MNNFAFIDGMNLHMTYENLTWRLDYQKFRFYLEERYFVTKAYYFIGNMVTNASLYLALEKDGYTVMTKPVSHLPGGKIKGNCDAELVLQVMIDSTSLVVYCWETSRFGSFNKVCRLNFHPVLSLLTPLT